MPRSPRKPKSSKTKNSKPLPSRGSDEGAHPPAQHKGESLPGYRTKPMPRSTNFKKPAASPTAPLDKIVAARSPASLAQNPVLRELAAGGFGVTATKEIRFDVTDYFDTPTNDLGPYFQWIYDPSQTPFVSGSAVSGSIPSRVLGADLYALPRFSLDSASSSVLFVSSVPMAAPGDNGVAGAARTTLLAPTSTPKWVKVGTWRAKSLFDTSTFEPLVNPQGGMAIFSGVLLDPDTLEAFSGTELELNKVQCKVVVHVAQALPQVVRMAFKYIENTTSNTLSDVVVGTPALTDTLIQITGMGDTS